MSSSAPRIWTCKALTDFWTGDAEGKPDRLITTGLLGSIRWWFEVLVRGLGGKPCDPTHNPNNKPGPCPVKGKQLDDAGHHCVVCELFGCTGWARKFRFDVLDENNQIKTGQTFKLRFTPFRSIREEEWALLDLTLRLIAEYGAIGGKTVFKPTDESARAGAVHHQDLGLFSVQEHRGISPLTEDVVRGYVQDNRWRKPSQDEFAWASLENFWFVNDKYLARQSPNGSTFNRVLRRDERKTCADCGQVHNPPRKCPTTKRYPQRHSDRSPSDAIGRWLAGGRGESKKVFSFKDPPRTFGFVNPVVIGLDFAAMRQTLKTAWPGFKDDELVEGHKILGWLLSAAGGGPK